MEPHGFIELEMGPVGEEISKQPQEVFRVTNDSMEETNYRTRAYEGLQNRGQHQVNILEVAQPTVTFQESTTSSGSDTSPRGKVKKESGLRSKRGGKSLKIQTERRKAHYIASMAENAPLYPLDLQDHGMDSSQDDESDRSSLFSPEVAANGFGSPIELPEREGFDELTRRLDERHVQVESLNTLDEIPLSNKFDTPTIVQQENNDDEDLLEGGATGRTSSQRSLPSYVLKTLFLILIWYCLSTLLTLYNKILLGKDEHHFPAPLLMNTIHFSMQALISTILVRCYPAMHPSVHMSWKDYFMRVVPTAIATALDVDLTNYSLVFVTVTFATMCKSGAPVFILIFAFLFKLEVPSYKLLSIIVIISTGVMLTVTKETNFNTLGFILIISAAVMSGFRWTVTQLLLQKQEYGLSNPFAAMSVLTPIMAAISLILSLILEPWRTLGETVYFDSSQHALGSCGLMLLGGALAFFMVSTEYILLTETSAVTLTVAGVVKEVVTILVAVLFLKDKFTLLKGVGLVVIILGVSLYNLFKYQNLKERPWVGEHLSSNVDGNHRYVALTETRSPSEPGDELDENIL